MKRKGNICLVGLIWTGFLLCGCAERESLSLSGLIRLGASGEGYTRSAVNDLEGLSAVGDRVGVFGVVTENADASSILTDEWNTTPLMDNVRTTAIDATSGLLSWADAYAYPLEEGQYVKFCLYHPYAEVGTEGANYVEMRSGSSPVLHFTLTGDEDLMWVSPVTGSRTQSPGGLVFNHLLTQLRFCLVDDEGNFAGTSLTALRFNGVNTTCSLQLETGEQGTWGTPSDAVVFSLWESFEEGASSVPISGTSTSPQVLKGSVMLQPGGSSFSLTVVTDNRGNFSNVVLRPTAGETTFAAGHSYLVTLKFRDRTPVALSATVTPWVMDGTGEGTVQ